MTLSPWRSLANTLKFALTGRLHFPKDRIGEHITMDDGQTFSIFRHAVTDSRAPPGSRFIVRFKLAGMCPGMNKPFSLIPMPFCIGVPGFRSKLWTLNSETGYFQVIYEFRTARDAENYAGPSAMKFMKGRSVPGSVSYRIIEI